MDIELLCATPSPSSVWNVSVTWLDPVYFPSETQVNELNDRVEAVEESVKEAFLTQEEYNAMVDAGTIDPNTKYYIYEE